jgi:hypothetical protein
MPKYKFTPIQLHTDKDVDIFEKNEIEISKAIIYGIDYGIKYKKPVVDFAEIVLKHAFYITLSIESSQFENLIEQNLQTLLKYEEYEMCALCVKLKNKLKKQSEKPNKQL